MTINDILNGRKNASDFYSQLRGTTLEKASAEPLKLKDLRKTGKFCAPKQALRTGLVVTYAGALCFCCIDDLLSKYTIRVKPDDAARIYMAGQIASRYEDWSVLDLPTFVDMCLGSHIATPGTGQMEYRLITLDIPNIMEKVAAYDKMRPARTRIYTAPAAPARKPMPMKYKMTHKFGGVEYQWTDEKACQAYWDGAADLDDQKEREARLSAGALLQDFTEKVS